MAATTISVSSPDDEPLEDSIAANGERYQKAPIGSDGRYVIQSLAAGTYFVTFTPAATDQAHLPGGSACRIARSRDALVGTRLDIQVSQAAPSEAEYIGTGRCVSCHGMMHISETLHRLGIWSPYESGPLQNQAGRETELWAALDKKFTEAGTTVYFYDYDATRTMDRYKTVEADPGSNVSFTATVFESSGSYKLRLHNVKNTADPDRTYDLAAVYGGGLWKQRYLTKVTNASGFFHAILPMQYQTSGVEHPSYGRTARVWRDYNAANWYDETSQTFKDPTPGKSFEKNCVSCHATGVQVTGSDATTWQASLLSDRIWGDFDFDGDGIRDEVNMGCETCHGPGSEHWARAGQSKAIVSPSLLTPEREAMICGQCHSRPKGALNTDSPVNAQGWMMRAGTARSQFLSEYAVKQLDGAPTDFYPDEAKHSKSHHQQYSDFIRSGMYKNDKQLMTCSDCHNPHERANVRQLLADPADNGASCGNSCHAAEANNQLAHITDKLGPDYGVTMATAPCVDCHMPKTAKTGAGKPGILVNGVQFWTNDVSSHLFDVPLKTAAAKPPTGSDMPTAYTNACGQACHGAIPQ